MKGFVPTPEKVVDHMVDKLFANDAPNANAKVLDPGAGRGAFVDGIIRWCQRNHSPLPKVAAVEANPAHAQYLKSRYAGERQIKVVEGDFLVRKLPGFDYIIGNPPYVAITGLSETERAAYRARYSTAKGRFDLYMLFMERSFRLLKPEGTLVFVTPEKYLYVETASQLRALLARFDLKELEFVDEDTFPGLVTYPLITTIRARPPRAQVSVIHRDGSQQSLPWSAGRTSWLPLLSGIPADISSLVLGDVCRRISCGVATGADSVYVVANSELDPALRQFARPTIAGRDIVGSELPPPRSSMLLPYDDSGRLLPERELGLLQDYLEEPSRKALLLERTCIQRKPWYAFHETPPLEELLRPKILCKDISSKPTFVIDPEGAIVPRHSVYYIIPRNPEHLEPLAEYLRSSRARAWLEQNSQRASKGFFRMQSHVLKALPIPAEFAAPAEQLGFDQMETTPRRSA
jgi:adenine-specific DNA-methyltransferase